MDQFTKFEISRVLFGNDRANVRISPQPIDF